MACVKPKVNVEVFTLTSVQYVNGRVENVYDEINMYVKLGSYPWSGAEWLRQPHHSPYYKTLYHLLKLLFYKGKNSMMLLSNSLVKLALIHQPRGGTKAAFPLYIHDFS